MNVPELNLEDIKGALKKEDKLPKGVLKIPEKGSGKLHIKLSEEGVKVKFKERSRGRMKFQIKFDNDEAAAFRNYCTVFKADDMHTDDFIKYLLFTGMRSHNETVNDAVGKIQNDPEAMLEAGLEINPPKEEISEEASGVTYPATVKDITDDTATSPDSKEA